MLLDFQGVHAQSARRGRRGSYERCAAAALSPCRMTSRPMQLCHGTSTRARVCHHTRRAVRAPPPLACSSRRASVTVHVSYFLTEPDADGASVLGSQQWQWLHALPALDAQQHVALTVLVSSIQMVNNQSYGSENWGLYPAERDRLLALLRTWPCSVIVISGDRHYSELAQECRSRPAACSARSDL
jgi:hypothetical protein